MEDPVEYILAGINQVQVNETVGLTFRDGVARHPAPGAERRDDRGNSRPGNRVHRHQRLAHRPSGLLHAAHQRRARRGHPSRDIGVKPFLVASSTRCLMAQRLVRKICKKCAEPYVPTERKCAPWASRRNVEERHRMKGRGCANCNNTGNRGPFRHL